MPGSGDWEFCRPGPGTLPGFGLLLVDYIYLIRNRIYQPATFDFTCSTLFVRHFHMYSFEESIVGFARPHPRHRNRPAQPQRNIPVRFPSYDAWAIDEFKQFPGFTIGHDPSRGGHDGGGLDSE